MRKFKNWDHVAALTGGMGSGKSTVLAMFRKKGALSLDADRIVRSLLRHHRGVQSRIGKTFGPAVLTRAGGIRRRALADRVFSSEQDRQKLERILHPLVRHEMARVLSAKRGRFAVCDIPLLFETKQERRYDSVIVVDARADCREKRLLKRGVEKSDIARRFKAQWPLSKKVKQADFVVDNNGTLQQTKKQVDRIWSQLIRRTHGIAA